MQVPLDPVRLQVEAARQKQGHERDQIFIKSTRSLLLL